jgi:small-conductance mechanosensitive channel
MFTTNCQVQKLKRKDRYHLEDEMTSYHRFRFTGPYRAGGVGSRMRRQSHRFTHGRSMFMNNIIYIVGVVVIVLAILAFFGLR